ncbi:hypothetical protein KBC03_03115 [Patescibacteria group bacterium]|nr:hypothetical protein [Patescibacteria group bacterium]
MLKQTKEILEQKVELIEKQLKDIDEQKANVEKQLELVKSNSKKNEFICDLIGDKPCPYVDLINSAYSKNIDKQQELLAKQLESLDKSKVEKEKVKVAQELLSAKSEYAGAIEEYKKFDFKKIKEEIDRYSVLDSARQEVDKKLLSLEKEKENQEEQKRALVELQASLSHYDESAKTLEKQQSEISDELTKIRATANINELDKIEAMLASIAKCMKLLEAVSDLVATHKNNMLMIKQLEEKETMLGQLYNIFSKEIMIYVLQQTLPLFADVLNNLLAKVVDYTVSFETNTTSDKIELEIKVHDAK